MKTRKNKNQKQEKRNTTKILALALMFVIFISLLPMFSLSKTDEETKTQKQIESGGGSAPSGYNEINEEQEKNDKEKDIITRDALLITGTGNAIDAIKNEAKNKVTDTTDIGGRRKANRDQQDDIRRDQKDKKDKWDLGSLVPCSGTTGANPYDCFLDIGSTILSVFKGISMGISLSRIKGSCSAEEPLKGLTASEQEDACKSCNDDPLRLCTLERCLVLGNCIPIAPEEGTAEEMANYICVPGKCEEIGAVGITRINAIFYSGGEEILSDSTNSDKLTISEEIPFNVDSVNIELQTNKLAQCRYSFEAQQDFEDMIDFTDNYFPGTVDEPESQSVTIMLPGNMPRGETHTIYIKCENVCGKAHDKFDDNHYTKFTFETKPDQLPPIIVEMDPDNGAAVSGELNNLILEFELDEQGYCKYSDNYTIDNSNNPAPLTTTWNDMTLFTEIQAGTDSAVVDGYCVTGTCQDLRPNECSHCFLELDLTKGYTEYDWEQLSPELQQELGLEEVVKMFHFMIRCADDDENIMVEEDTLDYSFFTMPPYDIEIIKPEQGESTYDVNPEIEVTSEERNTYCRYETKQLEDDVTQCPVYEPVWDDMTEIDGFFDKEHNGNVQEDLIPTIAGTPYCLYIKCRDNWLLERDDNVFFKVLLDVTAPRIIRMYHDIFAGDYLSIETNEETTCVYGTDDEIACTYEFEDGNEMTGKNETIHTAYWSLDHLYYIKCQDKWGNMPSANKCTNIINPFDIPEIPY